MPPTKGTTSCQKGRLSSENGTSLGGLWETPCNAPDVVRRKISATARSHLSTRKNAQQEPEPTRCLGVIFTTSSTQYSEREWLEDGLEAETATEIAQTPGRRVADFEWFPVDRAVGNVRNHGPQLVEPLAQ